MTGWRADRRPECVVGILGMHRSGTSCLAGTLQQAGLDLGEVHTANKYNRKGNRENPAVVDLHARLLRDNNSSWDQPPPGATTWRRRHERYARKIIARHAGKRSWGFKDPRTLLFIDGWLNIVPDISFIGIFRHPLLVARSLNARKDIPVTFEKGLEIWKRYNRSLLAHYEKSPFPVLSFDWPENQFHEKINRAAIAMGLTPVQGKTRFYSGKLHTHHLQGDEKLPSDIEALYKRLLAISQ